MEAEPLAEEEGVDPELSPPPGEEAQTAQIPPHGSGARLGFLLGVTPSPSSARSRGAPGPGEHGGLPPIARTGSGQKRGRPPHGGGRGQKGKQAAGDVQPQKKKKKHAAGDLQPQTATSPSPIAHTVYTMGKSSKKTDVKVAPAPASGKRNAEDGIERAAKKQKSAPERVVPVKNDLGKVKKQPPPKKVESSSSDEDSSESEEEVMVQPKKAAQSLKKESSSDRSDDSSSDNSSDDEPAASNGSKNAESDSSSSDSDSDDDDEDTTTKSVAVAAKKNKESSDSSDSDSDSDYEEVPPLKTLRLTPEKNFPHIQRTYASIQHQVQFYGRTLRLKRSKGPEDYFDVEFMSRGEAIDTYLNCNIAHMKIAWAEQNISEKPATGPAEVSFVRPSRDHNMYSTVSSVPLPCNNFLPNIWRVPRHRNTQEPPPARARVVCHRPRGIQLAGGNPKTPFEKRYWPNFPVYPPTP